jgi:hypothetical protein
MFVLQIMGAIAQFERALIVERTKAGLAAARAQNRVGGNSALHSCAEVLRRIAAGREQTRRPPSCRPVPAFDLHRRLRRRGNQYHARHARHAGTPGICLGACGGQVTATGRLQRAHWGMTGGVIGGQTVRIRVTIRHGSVVFWRDQSLMRRPRR